MYLYVATSEFAKAHKAAIIGTTKSLKDTLSSLQCNTPPLAEAEPHKVRYLAVWHSCDKESDINNTVDYFQKNAIDTPNTVTVRWHQFKKDNFMEEIEELVSELDNKFRIF